jgi:hypothetical protein
MFLSSVGGREHTSIEIRAKRGFLILWMYVLVFGQGHEHTSIVELGQEFASIADLKTDLRFSENLTRCPSLS